MNERNSKLNRLFPYFNSSKSTLNKNDVTDEEVQKFFELDKCMFDTSALIFICRSLHFRSVYKNTGIMDIVSDKIINKIKKKNIIPCICPEVIREINNDGNTDRKNEVLNFIKENKFVVLNKDKADNEQIKEIAKTYIKKDLFGKNSYMDAKILATANFYNCNYVYSGDNHFVKCNSNIEQKKVKVVSQVLEDDKIKTSVRKEKFNVRVYDSVNRNLNLNSAKIIGVFSQRNK